ncbi:hypothetical protein EI200_19595 [Peribacillus simplex]|nr:hypothetical protein EI200_19595 [Peribacillus simplex]
MNCTPIVRHHNGKKPASYQLLRASSMPTVLTECGLIDHAEDAAALQISRSMVLRMGRV